jgi:hypothetical protein
LVVFSRGKIIYTHFMIMPSRKPFAFDCPGIYQISVQGQIDPTWSDRLENMKIGVVTLESGTRITTLQGELRDQTALSGVLNALYELHLTVLSVVRMDID